MAAPPVKATERIMLDALWARLSAAGTRNVMAEHVRYDVTYGRSIADALSFDTWRSNGTGHCLHGYEVKVSRSDFLREVNDEPKHQVWAAHCRYWWIVVPDITVCIPRGQRPHMPYGWGLLVLQGRWLRQVLPAKRRPLPAPLPDAAMAGLMRATSATARFHALTHAERLLLDRDPERAAALRWATPQEA